MREAAEQTFRKAKTIRARPWISDDTLEALTAARKAEAEGEPESKTKRNTARRLARTDKIKWVHDQLMNDLSGEAHSMWKTVRRQRVGFREKKQRLVVDEKPIPWSKTHEAFKTHLETKQWAPNTSTPESIATLRERPPLRPQRQDEDSFSLEELEGALGKLKKNKAPGPDKVSNELVLLMDPQTKTLLLGYYNQTWAHGEAPDSWNEAVVVSIYKGKGADTDPSDYRPISLLNAIYKLFATNEIGRST